MHKASVTANVRHGDGDGRRRRATARQFGTTTNELLALSDWLAGFGVTPVVMEATGVYQACRPIALHGDLRRSPQGSMIEGGASSLSARYARAHAPLGPR